MDVMYGKKLFTKEDIDIKHIPISIITDAPTWDPCQILLMLHFRNLTKNLFNLIF